MGRSKFPGKPPKTVTRKRIKVLAWPEATQSDSVTVAENIYYGLSLFNETFGDNEKVIRASLCMSRIPRKSGRMLLGNFEEIFSSRSSLFVLCVLRASEGRIRRRFDREKNSIIRFTTKVNLM